MKNYQKGYLELNRIWMSRQEYEAHQKRLLSIKNPRLKMNVHQEYNNQKEQNFYYKMRQEQLINNRKKELYRWQDIQEQNNLFLRRLVKINSRQSSPLTPPHSQSGTPKGGQKRNQLEVKHKIQIENKRLKDKLLSMEACIKSQSFSVSFEKHKKYKENMQKFLRDSSSQRIKLRVDQFIDTLQHQRDRIHQKVSNRNKPFMLVGQPKFTHHSLTSPRPIDISDGSLTNPGKGSGKVTMPLIKGVDLSGETVKKQLLNSQGRLPRNGVSYKNYKIRSISPPGKPSQMNESRRRFQSVSKPK